MVGRGKELVGHAAQNDFLDTADAAPADHQGVIPFPGFGQNIAGHPGLTLMIRRFDRFGREAFFVQNGFGPGQGVFGGFFDFSGRSPCS